MADEDFEIDVYGDANGDGDTKVADTNTQSYESNTNITIANGSNPPDPDINDHGNYNPHNHNDVDGHDNHGAPSQHYQQGVKRKTEDDDRPVDPGATNCLLLSELNWWTTDDDIRGWIKQGSCEDELRDITYSEHKVNGKSKGQAYLEFMSQQAATAAKHAIESPASDGSQPGAKKHTVMYSSPSNNPFRTLPKDAPARAKDSGGARGGASGGFERGGGNFRGRGNFNGPRGGGYGNRNFSGGNMGGGPGFQHNNNNMGGGGFNNNMGPGGGGGNFGFNNMAGGGGNFGGFRGGMMGNNMGGGMRGGGMRGRGGAMGGGMNPGMGGGMMGGMNMGMPMMGFQQPHFNPAFFGGNQQSDWQNPHGAKRPRGE